MARIGSWFLAAAGLVFATGAQAQFDDEFGYGDSESERAAPEDEAADEAPEREAPEKGPSSRVEEPGKGYLFVGAAWRYTRMPAWTLEWFLESAPALGAAGSFFGEVGYRKDGFQVTGSLGYMKWNFNGPFQMSGDPDVDTEWLDTNWNLLLATATFTWSTAFTDWFSLEYGIEAGLAFIFGDMKRTEAYRTPNGDFAPCLAAGNPNPTYCDYPLPENGVLQPATNSAGVDGAHYGVTAERGIFNGGVPYVMPVLGPRLALRFKPIQHVVVRVDVPLPVLPLGFVGGIAAQYGF